jgi:hypothetical protein
MPEFNEPERILLRDDGREDDCSDGGSAEKVMDAPLPITPADVPVEEERTWGWKRDICDAGVAGTCAICAIPLGVRSMLSKVVGFVLAAILLKV